MKNNEKNTKLIIDIHIDVGFSVWKIDFIYIAYTKY